MNARQVINSLGLNIARRDITTANRNKLAWSAVALSFPQAVRRVKDAGAERAKSLDAKNTRIFFLNGFEIVLARGAADDAGQTLITVSAVRENEVADTKLARKYVKLLTGLRSRVVGAGAGHVVLSLRAPVGELLPKMRAVRRMIERSAGAAATQSRDHAWWHDGTKQNSIHLERNGDELVVRVETRVAAFA